MFLLAANAAPNGLENLSTLFDQFTDWMKDLVGTITSSPILMLTLGIFVVGAVDFRPTLKKSRCFGEGWSEVPYANTECLISGQVCNA